MNKSPIITLASITICIWILELDIQLVNHLFLVAYIDRKTNNVGLAIGPLMIIFCWDQRLFQVAATKQRDYERIKNI